MNTKLISLFLILGLYIRVNCQESGTFKLETISCPSLQNAILPQSPMNEIGIYLPKSYNQSDQKYPVIYFLLGFEETVKAWIMQEGMLSVVDIRFSLQKINNNEAYKEAIVVFISGKHDYTLGSFYANSPLTGNWEDFVVNDVINYIDENYRTLPKKESRAICGFSMGGTGAFNIALKHPEKFNVLFCLSQGLFSPNGLKESFMFDESKDTTVFFTFQSKFKGLTRSQGISKYKTELYKLDFYDLITIAYGSAFSCDTSLDFPSIGYPYKHDGTTDSVYWRNWYSGFGNLEQKISQYKESLLSYKSLNFQSSKYEDYQYINLGYQHLVKVLTDSLIPFSYSEYNGSHGGDMNYRFENYLLPTCLNNLEYDTNYYSSKTKILEVNFSGQYGKSMIDTLKHIVTTYFVEKSSFAGLTPTLKISAGAQIKLADNEDGNFEKGHVNYLVISENKQDTTDWTISVENYTPLDNADLLSIRLALQVKEAEIDYENKIVYLVVPSNISTISYLIEFEISEKATSSISSGSSINFTNNTKTLKITSESKKVVNTWTLILSTNTSVIETNHEKAFEISEIDNQLNISCTETINTFTVFSITGEKVFIERNLHKKTVTYPLTLLNQGVYIFKINTDKNEYFTKFVNR